MQLNCPNCGAAIPARQINIQHLVAVCESCDAVFGVDADTLPSAKQKRRKVPQPEKMTVTEEDGKLNITILWRENLGWLEGLLAIIVGAFIIAGMVGFSSFIVNGQWLLTPPALLFIAFFVYLLATFFVNRAEISLDADSLTYYDRPLRTYFWDVEMDTREIANVSVQSYDMSQNPKDDYGKVLAQMENGTQKTIIDVVRQPQAEFIAQVLNEYIMDAARARENPFADDHETATFTTDGEIPAAEADDEPPVALDDLLREDRENTRRDDGR
jgi:hypothetical protein